ncbi:MAG: hypothetical protein R3C26_14225 [Calditrichia bacterium]
MSKQPTLSGNPSLSTEKVNINEQIEQFWEQIRQFNYWINGFCCTLLASL